MEELWIKQLKELFFVTDAEKVDFQSAMLLKHQHTPKQLFKFRKFGNYSLENFRADTLHCDFASTFNDPYDCAITFDPYVDLSSMAKMASRFGLAGEELARLGASEDPLKTLIDIARQSMPEAGSKFYNSMYLALKSRQEETRKELVQGFTNWLRNGFKICSLSRRINSILMWGHYADCHKGFAMEYDFSVLSVKDRVTRYLWPVLYDRKLYDASYVFSSLGNDKANFNSFFGVIAALYKSDEWSYEKEWRIIIPSIPGSSAEDVSVPRPVGVYLGAHMSPKEEAQVAEIAKLKQIPIYKMHLSHTEFRMEAKPYQA